MSAGIPPHIFWDYTYREVYAVFTGRNLRSVRDHKIAMFSAWHAAAWTRAKKMPNLPDALRKLEPARVLSTKAMRSQIFGMASAMGAKVRYVKKGEL